MIESEIYKYYRNLNKLTPKNEVLVEQMGSENIFISVTDNTFYIYDVNKFNILFMGPYIPGVESYYFYKDILYISSGNRILMFKRGLKVDEIVLEMGITAVKIVCFGEAICVLSEDKRLFIYLGGDFQLLRVLEDVKDICHPITYVNKLVIVFSNEVILYNIMKDKRIYTYKNIEADVISIKESKNIDIVGIGYPERVDIVDLKKDKILSSYKTNNSSFIDFSSNRMLVCNGDLHIFDLEKKKKIITERNIHSSKFIDDRYILKVSKDKISVDEIEGYKLDVIKKMDIGSNGILEVGFLNRKNLIVVDTSSVSCYNLYNDSSNYKIPCGGITNCKINGEVAIIAGEREIKKLLRLDFNNKKLQLVLKSRIEDMEVYEDACIFSSKKIYLVGLNSGVVREVLDSPKFHYRDLKIFKDYIFMNTKEFLLIIKGKEEYKLMEKDITFYKVYEDVLILQKPSSLLFYKYQDGNIECFRVFNTREVFDFDVDPNLKLLAVLEDSVVSIYDIATTLIKEKIELPRKFKLLRISNDLFFLVLVDFDDSIILLSNKLASTKKKGSGYSNLLTTLSATSRSQNLENGVKKLDSCLSNSLIFLQMHKTDTNKIELISKIMDDGFIRSLSREDVMNILELILENLDNFFELSQFILNRILRFKYKYSILEKEDLSKFYTRYSVVSNRFLEDYNLVLGKDE